VVMVVAVLTMAGGNGNKGGREGGRDERRGIYPFPDSVMLRTGH
jgi:hypothetical protein